MSQIYHVLHNQKTKTAVAVWQTNSTLLVALVECYFFLCLRRVCKNITVLQSAMRWLTSSHHIPSLSALWAFDSFCDALAFLDLLHTLTHTLHMLKPLFQTALFNSLFETFNSKLQKYWVHTVYTLPVIVLRLYQHISPFEKLKKRVYTLWLAAPVSIDEVFY